MNEKIETQGKTVDDAVNEALLRLGARRDEVDVTVLDEPKSGFLGLLGGRPAKVEVSRKRNSRRGQRRPKGNQEAHEFGESTRSGNKSRGGRDRNRSNNKPRNDKRQGAQVSSEEPVATSSNKRNNEDRQRGGRDSDRNSRNRRPRQQKNNNQDNRRKGNQSQAAAEVTETSANTVNERKQQEPRQQRRPRNERRPRNSRAPRNERPQQQNGNTIEGAPVENTRQPRNDKSQRQECQGRKGRPEKREPRAARVQNTVPDEIIVSGISAGKYAKPIRGLSTEDLNSNLEEMTAGLLVRAGFPSRCEVKDGDYLQVRVTTDDESAGMLIGRHGATIDSVEHLVERMISMGIGDRVKMNLDINNYRHRRHDTLLERVEEAVAQVKETGKTYHVEPLNARERRIVHLAVEKFEGLRTFTMDSHRGRHVIIALANEEKEENQETASSEETVAAEVSAEVEAPVEETSQKDSIEVEIYEEERPQD